jgi:hypothetical protein
MAREILQTEEKFLTLKEEKTATQEGKIKWEIFTRLYKATTPTADFEKLIEEAQILRDTDGVYRRKIDFDKYEIDPKIMSKIIDDVLKENKINPMERLKYHAEVTFDRLAPSTK